MYSLGWTQQGDVGIHMHAGTHMHTHIYSCIPVYKPHTRILSENMHPTMSAGSVFRHLVFSNDF